MPIWDDIIPEHDKEVYNKRGYGKKVSFGNRLALVIIDVTYSFVGDKPEPVLESIKRFPQSCGEAGWKAIQHIIPLLALARDKKIPIIYSDRKQRRLIRKWDILDSTVPKLSQGERGHQIVKEIAPIDGEIIIYKEGASIFFASPFISLLTPLGIDTLLVCGCTTSGCVRASVIDAAQYGFRVGVIEECTFDRFESSHKVNLFDMNAKYANVVSVVEAKDYLFKIHDKD